MFIYSITYNIETDIETDWMGWMRIVHLPRIMATGYFVDYKMYRLLDVKEEGSTYSIQFFASSLDKIQTYLEQEAPMFAEEHNHRYRHKHVAFRTVLQEIDK